MSAFYNLCRLCLKDSHHYCNIFGCCLMELINQVYELDISLNDGLPEFLCVECLSKFKEFLTLKKKAHNGRSALLLLQKNYEAGKLIDSQAYENTSEDVEAIIKKEPVTLKGLESEEYKNYSKAVEVTFSIAEESDVGTTVTIIKEECIKSHSSKTEELTELQASANVSMAFEHITSDIGGTYFDLSITGNTIKQENLEIDDEMEDKIDCVAGFEEDGEEDPLAENLPSVKEELLESQDRENVLETLEGISSNAGWTSFSSKGNLISEKSFEEWNAPPVSTEPGTSAGSTTTASNMKFTSSLGEEFGDVRKPRSNGERIYHPTDHCGSFNGGHRSTRPKGKIFLCSYCEKEFFRKDFLRRHLNVHERVRKKKQYPCDFCKKEFNSVSNLDDHLRTHTGEQPYECQFCFKRFTQKSNLHTHFKTHSEVRPFKCNLCAMSFKWKSCLKRHLLSHAVEVPFQCDLCLKKYYQKVRLRVHLSTHCRGNNFECGMCHETFKDKTNLKYHLMTHGAGGTFVCCVCLESFADETNLRRHFKTHVGENQSLACRLNERGLNSHTLDESEDLKFPLKKSRAAHLSNRDRCLFFECSLCRKKFSQKSVLTTHLRTHSGEKPFACHVCERSFVASTNLNRHLKVHSGERHFQCDVCQKRFARSDNLKQHSKSHNVN